MQLLSFLGSEPFYLLVMPAVVWCLDVRVGLRMGLVLLHQRHAQQTSLSSAFGWPRPYWVSDQVQGLAHEGRPALRPRPKRPRHVGGVGDRSASSLGHSRPWDLDLSDLALKVYLGVHFPSDVLAGWAIAAILLLAIAWAERPVEAWLKGRPLGVQLLAPVVLSLGLLVVGLLVAQRTADRVVPTEWTAAASQAFPTSRRSIAEPGRRGLRFRDAARPRRGCRPAAQLGRFSATGPTGQRLARMVAGLLGILLIYYGLGALRPHGSDGWLSSCASPPTPPSGCGSHSARPGHSSGWLA